jgi:hypothetical protein
MTTLLKSTWGEEVAIRNTNLYFEKCICESPLLHPRNHLIAMSFRAERGIYTE